MDNADQSAIDRIVAAARAAPGGGHDAELQAAVRDAEPNDRGLAAKELADEGAALEALHGALRALGIETAEGD